MGNPNLSRRDILKLAAIGFGGFLAACTRMIKATPLPPVIPTATLTPTSTSTNTPEPNSTSTPTDTPSPTPIPCFKLLTPENGTKLPAIGKVTFSWEAMPGATRYQLQITLPSGQVVPFDVEGTSSTRYMESFLTAGIYHWQVIALQPDGTVICTSESCTFEKPAMPSGNNGGGGAGGGNWSTGITPIPP